MLSLLGMRHTEGSLDSFPPSMRECQAVFDTPHKPNTPSVLTVGAKALTKHCHRDETASWWGTVTVSFLCSVFRMISLAARAMARPKKGAEVSSSGSLLWMMMINFEED